MQRATWWSQSGIIMTAALFNIQIHSLTKTLSIDVSCNLPVYASKDNYLPYKMSNVMLRNIYANVIQKYHLLMARIL